MAEIQPIVKEETLKFWQSQIAKARVTIDGVTGDYDFYHREINGDTILNYVYVISEEGTITRSVVVDSQGREWQVKNQSYKKGPDGYMIAFRMKIEIQGDDAQ